MTDLLRQQLRQLAGAAEFDGWLALYAVPAAGQDPAQAEAAALDALLLLGGGNVYTAAATILEGLVDVTGEGVAEFRAEGQLTVKFDRDALPAKLARLYRQARRAGGGGAGRAAAPVPRLRTAAPTVPAFTPPDSVRAFYDPRVGELE